MSAHLVQRVDAEMDLINQKAAQLISGKNFESFSSFLKTTIQEFSTYFTGG